MDITIIFHTFRRRTVNDRSPSECITLSYSKTPVRREIQRPKPLQNFIIQEGGRPPRLHPFGIRYTR